MEQTLAIVKPDGVSRHLAGDVIKRIESKGLRIAAMKMVHLTKRQAEGFYAVHRGRPFYEDLTTFMSSGPAVAMVLEGENAIARWRELMGATDFRKAAEGYRELLPDDPGDPPDVGSWGLTRRTGS